MPNAFPPPPEALLQIDRQRRKTIAMQEKILLPEKLFFDNSKINLYCLHELFKGVAGIVKQRLLAQESIDIPITAGMWGGSYLIADKDGRARTNVVRLYNIINLPQISPLDDPSAFDKFICIYHETYQEIFQIYGLEFADPRWGEKVPYTNIEKPNITLQMWDKTKRVNYLRAFFVWNTGTWEESIIFDTIRNIKQMKELLDINKRPPQKSSEEYKFLLQDVLIIYHTLHAALTKDFLEHAEPIMSELLEKFLAGMHDDELIKEQFLKVYQNGIVYGFEEAMESSYKKAGLDIHLVEEWPVSNINRVPHELMEKLEPRLAGTFSDFKKNLEAKFQKSMLIPWEESRKSPA